MIGRYTGPADDLMRRLSPTITFSGTGSPAVSDEDPAYPSTNWLFRRPSRQVKLLTTFGRIVWDFGDPVNLAAFGLFNHNFDSDLPLFLQWNSVNSWASPAGSQVIPIPDETEDGWTVDTWIEVTGSPTARYYSLLMGAEGSPLSENGSPLAIGYPYFAGALRDLGDVLAIPQDVKWGVQETEEHIYIGDETEFGAENIYPIGSKREAWTGELSLFDDSVASLVSLVRSAVGRTHPFMVIPDYTKPRAAMVRLSDPGFSQTREIPNQSTLPYRVRELTRGAIWPYPET